MSALPNHKAICLIFDDAARCETSAKSANAGYTGDLNLEDTPTERCAFAIENLL